jgi:hypothetical protein
VPQFQPHLAVIRDLEPLGRHGRPQDVPADPFEPIAVPVWDHQPGVQIEPIRPSVTAATLQPLTDLRRLPHTLHGPPDGHPPLHRGGGQIGQHRRVLGPPVALRCRVVVGQSASLEQTGHALDHGGQDFRDVQRVERGTRVKAHGARWVRREHAVEHERMHGAGLCGRPR